MKSIVGAIYDYKSRLFRKGTIYFNSQIENIVYDKSISTDKIIIPGFVDAHVHIESSMLTPQYYAHQALKYGVISAVTDPHEIANVCGIEGVYYMKEQADLCGMKILTGAPSCVPATSFETSGFVVGVDDVEYLFKNKVVSHLSEMMNFPGVIYGDDLVVSKLNIAKKYNAVIDGHAPGLLGLELKKYVDAGISTDHECTSVEEAKEKIDLGMKVLIRKSSASNDFKVLHSLVDLNTDDVMLCSDDCHADDMERGYLKRSIDDLIGFGYKIEDIIQVASVNPVMHYGIEMGLLQVGDPADFLIVDNYRLENIEDVYIDGELMLVNKKVDSSRTINKFYSNYVTVEDIKVVDKGGEFHVIDIVDESLLTKDLKHQNRYGEGEIRSDVSSDVLKVVVLNRYKESSPTVGFIRGIGLSKGAIATTVAHDSHNIIACGVDDEEIVKAIKEIQRLKGGLVVVKGDEINYLQLEVGGLMTNRSCSVVANEYKKLLEQVRRMGSELHSPFMTLSFMSLLVIPSIKIGDKGLFDVDKFKFINLQD